MTPNQIKALISLTFIGLFIIVVLAHRIYRLSDEDRLREVPPPLAPDDYERRLERNRQGYLEAMSQFDKLVPWASAGALVVSLTFVSSFAPVAEPWTKWILGAAWLALAGALLSSILSQYSSTRIKVSGRRYLKARQDPPDSPRDEDEFKVWSRETIELDHIRRRHGRNTKLLNVMAGALLIIGILLMGVFAIVAIPFGTASQNTVGIIAA